VTSNMVHWAGRKEETHTTFIHQKLVVSENELIIIHETASSA